MLTDEEKATLQAARVGELKQACLDLMKEAGELFDRLDAHGLEAAWEGDGALVMRMEKAHEALRSFLARQATQRLMAFGLSPERLAELDLSLRGGGGGGGRA